ncbi:MAG: hypothetical protein NC417_13925 [Candidatus Gastranaerophilales bacterium]|nr:hypothetical protein [Candidatus Gastranaerophilales bacterium]
MEKYWKKVVLCALILAMLLQGGCGQEEAVLPELLFQYKADYWEIYDLSESAVPDREKFENLTREYMKEIQELLGLNQWWKENNPDADTLVVTLIITNPEGKKSHSEYGTKGLKNEVETTITLGGFFLAQPGYDGFLAHELTHVMVGPVFSQSLEEGLCCYVQDSVGVKKIFYPGLQEMGVEYWQCFKIYYEYTKETWAGSAEEVYASVTDSIGKAGRGYDFSGHARTIWQWYCESFVRYLMEQYGTDKVLELMDVGENEASYEQILGRTLEELRADWFLYVESIEQEYTWEDADAIEEEYLKEYKR